MDFSPCLKKWELVHSQRPSLPVEKVNAYLLNAIITNIILYLHLQWWMASFSVQEMLRNCSFLYTYLVLSQDYLLWCHMVHYYIGTSSFLICNWNLTSPVFYLATHLSYFEECLSYVYFWSGMVASHQWPKWSELTVNYRWYDECSNSPQILVLKLVFFILRFPNTFFKSQE